MPCTVGSPSGRLSMRPISASQISTLPPNWPLNNGASQSPSLSSLMPGICVRPVMRRVAPSVMPRRMNNEANVTMKDGRPVFTTSQPLR
jgi:hypothetical protein